MFDHKVEMVRQQEIFSREDAPTERRVLAAFLYHAGLLYRRIEAFFRDTKQGLSLGNYELRQAAGASGDWPLLMLAYSLLKLGVAYSVLGTVISRATSLRTDLKFHSVKPFTVSSRGSSQPNLKYRRSRARSRRLLHVGAKPDSMTFAKIILDPRGSEA